MRRKTWIRIRPADLFRLTAHVLLLTSCAVTPLSNRIQVGEDPFVIGIGEGADSMTDLYAAPASGGTFVRVTFTRAEERLPRLSPLGTAVAFVRREGTRERARWSLVILDLRTTVERTALLPPEVSAIARVGWTPDGRAAVIAAGDYFMLPASGESDALTRVGPGAILAADSMTRMLLGEPPSAMVRDCDGGGMCIVSAAGEISTLESAAADVIRWGPDSVAYAGSRGFTVRPLAGGASRWPEWSGKPSGLRNLTYHPGKSPR